MSYDAELRIAWVVHVRLGDDVLERLLARHREAHRRYHGVAHVAWVVRHVAELAAVEPVDDLGALVAAAFYHDAVYDPASATNERASARLARRDLAEPGPDRQQAWTAARVDAVATLIEGTAGHADPPDHDAAVFFDADLAVLGADVRAYDAYVTGVRAEYEHVGDEGWRAGRAAVLEGFLGRERIFATATGRDRWEELARANITAELAVLGR